VFGRHFVTDVIFAGVVTIAVVAALYLLLLDPIRRNEPGSSLCLRAPR
jgi:lipid A 4'-phosphatase